MTRARPLRDTEREQFVKICRIVAAQYEAAKAPDVQRLLGEATQFGFPSNGYSEGVSSGRAEDTTPERLAMRPDRPAADAVELLDLQYRTMQQLERLALQLAAWDPKRAVRFCKACGTALEDGVTRCIALDDDGRQCGNREGQVRKCDDCNRTMQVGEYLRDGKCNKCRMRAERAARAAPRIAGVDRLKLGTGTEVMEADQ